MTDCAFFGLWSAGALACERPRRLWRFQLTSLDPCGTAAGVPDARFAWWGGGAPGCAFFSRARREIAIRACEARVRTSRRLCGTGTLACELFCRCAPEQSRYVSSVLSFPCHAEQVRVPRSGIRTRRSIPRISHLPCHFREFSPDTVCSHSFMAPRIDVWYIERVQLHALNICPGFTIWISSMPSNS